MRIANPEAHATPAGLTRTMAARIRGLVPMREDLIDAGFLIVLLVAAFAGFATTFDSWWFALPVALGLALGLLSGHVITAWRWPAAVGLVTALFWYFLLGGALADRADTFYGLPTWTSTKLLGSLLVSGWKGMLTTLPPLAADGVYVALVFLLALLAATFGQIVSRRTVRTSPALIVPLLALGAAVALGTMDAPFAAWQGMVFALVGFGWLANRHPRRRQVIGSGKLPRMSLVLGAATLVAALAGGFFLSSVLPGTTAKPRLIARTYVAPPIDMRDYVSPLTGFRKYSSKELDVYFDKELLAVSGLPAKTWLRFAVMDSYNGHVWSATGDEADSGSGFVRLGTKVPGGPSAGVVDAQVTIKADYASNTDLNAWLPGVGNLATVAFDGPNARAHADAMRFDLATNQGLVPDRLRADDQIRLATTILPVLNSLEDGPTPGSGRRVADADSDFLAPLAQTLSSDKLAPMARLRQAADKLRSGAWSDGTVDGQQSFLPGHGQFRLLQFSTGTEYVGSDEQYAAAFALVANRYGFPARVVIGATLPESGIVKGADVKAWVELQVNDSQWVTVPTDVFTPDRSKAPSESPKQADDQSSATNVPPPNPPRPPGSYGDMLDTDPASGRITPPKATIPDAVRIGLLYVVAPLGGIILILGLILLAKALRRRRRSTSGELWHRIAAGWREVLDQARDMGRNVPVGATRLEQGALIDAGRLRPLAEGANAAVFSGSIVTDHHVREYWQGVRQARSEMLKTLPWWRRMLAVVSIRSLLPLGRKPAAQAKPGSRTRGQRPEKRPFVKRESRA